MNQRDIDKLLKRRLYIQRYITQTYNDVIEELGPQDRALVQLLRDFGEDGDESQLLAFSQRRRGNPAAQELLNEIRRILRESRDLAEDITQQATRGLLDREVIVVQNAVDPDQEPPSAAGLAAIAVGGASLNERFAYAFQQILRRVIQTSATAAINSPQSMGRLIRGNRSNNFRDGVLFWRNERVLRPEIDVIINGGADIAADKVYQRNRVEHVTWLGTLDFRICVRCMIAETNSPYPIGEAPPYPMHPKCLPGDALITTSDRIAAVSERWFDGDLIIVRTASGKKITCSPNHPILTRAGFVPASRLYEVGHVISAANDGCVGSVVNNNNEHIKTPIKEISNSFRRSDQVMTVEVPCSPVYFHGDGVGSEIAIIRADRELLNGINSAFGQSVPEFDFSGRHVAMTGLSTFGEFAKGLKCFRTLVSSMREAGLMRALLGSHLGPFESLGFALSPENNAVSFESQSDYISGHPEAYGYGVNGFSRGIPLDDRRFVEGFSSGNARSPFVGGASSPPGDSAGFQAMPDDILRDTKLVSDLLAGLPGGDVFIDQIIGIDVCDFRGHVYNLETESGAYVADGIVTHNCRCLKIPEDDPERTRQSRPFVRDDRPVKDIPKEERERKIGQTTDTISQFFDRWTEQEKRNYLGRKRYELLRDGKIDSLEDLIDERTYRPLTLAELPE